MSTVILYKKTSPKKAVYEVGGGGSRDYWHQNQIYKIKPKSSLPNEMF